MGCGCEGRKNRLNEMSPGLGDKVEKGIKQMPDILRPDMKSIVWLAIGAFLVPILLRKVG